MQLLVGRRRYGSGRPIRNLPTRRAVHNQKPTRTALNKYNINSPVCGPWTFESPSHLLDLLFKTTRFWNTADISRADIRAFLKKLITLSFTARPSSFSERNEFGGMVNRPLLIFYNAKINPYLSVTVDSYVTKAWKIVCSNVTSDSKQGVITTARLQIVDLDTKSVRTFQPISNKT